MAASSSALSTPSDVGEVKRSTSRGMFFETKPEEKVNVLTKYFSHVYRLPGEEFLLRESGNPLFLHVFSQKKIPLKLYPC